MIDAANRTVLLVERLTRRYGQVLANDQVSLAVRAGQVVGLLGHNGAGKTTLVSQLVGLLRPDGGSIRVAGVDAVAQPALARQRVALQPQAQAPLDGFTPRLAIQLAGRVRGLTRRDAAAAALTLADELDIGPWLDRRALPEGGGTNAVNVLLVDFRGFDTLGEITVLCIVALTVYALLRRFRPAPESIAIPAQQTSPLDAATRQTPAEQANSGYLLVAGVYMRLLLPFMGITAVYFFLRGHNLPGGGFVAGLIFSVALIVQYMLAGTHWVEARMHLRPHRWLGYGLVLACATGLGAWAFGYPFLTSHTAHLDLPLLGELHLPSAFFFDLGVFVTVVGCTMLILVALGHQSIRSHRVPERPDAAKEGA